MTPKSYDQKQADAVRIICQACGREFYMTHPRPICVECREQAAKDGAA